MCFQVGCFAVDVGDPAQSTQRESASGSGISCDQLDGGVQVFAAGQGHDGVVVAGEQAHQVQVGTVGQDVAFAEQVVSVVQEGTQVSGCSDGEPVTPSLGTVDQPGLEHLFRAALDHVQKACWARAVPCRGQVDDHGDILVIAAGMRQACSSTPIIWTTSKRAGLLISIR